MCYVPIGIQCIDRSVGRYVSLDMGQRLPWLAGFLLHRPMLILIDTYYVPIYLLTSIQRDSYLRVLAP